VTKVAFALALGIAHTADIFVEVAIIDLFIFISYFLKATFSGASCPKLYNNQYFLIKKMGNS